MPVVEVIPNHMPVVEVIPNHMHASGGLQVVPCAFSTCGSVLVMQSCLINLVQCHWLH